MANVLVQWLRTGGKESPKEMAAFIARLVNDLIGPAE